VGLDRDGAQHQDAGGTCARIASSIPKETAAASMDGPPRLTADELDELKRVGLGVRDKK
jgi:hypothetical protein